jgi:lipoprotein-releasing system permease protein
MTNRTDSNRTNTPFPWWIGFVAHRYLGSRRKEKKLSTSLLSIGGITMGVLALNLVLGVMNGFQLGTIEDILELNSFHIQWTPNTESQAFDFAQQARIVPGVRHTQPFVDIQGLIQGNFVDLQGMQLRAVDPLAFQQDIQGLAMRRIISGTPLPNMPGTILLGSELARFLGVRTGEVISLVSITSPDLDLRNPQEVMLRVSGIFDTGYFPYDRNWGIISIETLELLFDWDGQIQVGIKLQDRFQDLQAMDRLRPLLYDHPGDLTSWRTLNRAIFGALRVEKTLMLFLVSLIFLVVGVNIYQGLRRVIHDRTRDIGVFKALGASPKEIQGVFVLEGWLIGGIGAGLGTGLAFLVGAQINPILNWFQSLSGGTNFAREFFYVSEIPIDMLLGEVLFVSLFGLASAVFAAVGASRAVRRVVPVEVFQEE